DQQPGPSPPRPGLRPISSDPGDGPAGRAIAGAARRGPHLPHPAEAVLGPWTPAPSGPRAPYLPQPVRGEGVDRRALRVLVARPCPAGSVAVLADRPAPRRPR